MLLSIAKDEDAEMGSQILSGGTPKSVPRQCSRSRMNLVISLMAA